MAEHKTTIRAHYGAPTGATPSAADIKATIESLLTSSSYMPARDAVAAGIIANMRDALEDCLAFLADRPWGTVNYMEGSEVYSHIRNCQRVVRAALGVPQVD